MLPLNYTYLVGTAILLAVWLVLFLLRKDLRKPMLIMGLLIGVLSVATAYYWWTVDWWRPVTITGTLVGVEDFLAGFASGGIVVAAYEVIFRKHLYKAHIRCIGCPSYFSLLLLLALLISWLFWGIGLTSFWASTIAMLVIAGILFYYRRDLVLAGVVGGVVMGLISIPIYVFMSYLSPEWIRHTYLFDTLSGALFIGVPVEEFVFWFLTGLVFGPFYEYWQGLRIRKEAARARI